MEHSTLAVVVPRFNEGPVIGEFLTELLGVRDRMPDVDGRVFVVDEGSTDSSLDQLNAIARRDSQARHGRLHMVQAHDRERVLLGDQPLSETPILQGAADFLSDLAVRTPGAAIDAGAASLSARDGFVDRTPTKVAARLGLVLVSVGVVYFRPQA